MELRACKIGLERCFISPWDTQWWASYYPNVKFEKSRYRKETHRVVTDSHRYIVGELGAYGSQDTPSSSRARAQAVLRQQTLSETLRPVSIYSTKRPWTRVDCEPDIPVHFYKRAESIPCSDSVRVTQYVLTVSPNCSFQGTYSIFCARLFRVIRGLEALMKIALWTHWQLSRVFTRAL